MSQIKYPLCYHPTTIVIVNGDRFYLDQICKAVNPNIAIIKPFMDPIAALDYINSFSIAPFNRRCTHALDDESNNRHSMGINLKMIGQEIYEKNRFSQISTVITDYNMPKMDGFELCESIANSHINKVLLTKIMDATLITDAFNRGLINKYVHSEADDFKEKLNSTLIDVQKNYFLRYSNILFTTAISRLSTNQTVFTEKSFISLFQRILDEYKINEYYLTETNGSYLMHTQDDTSYLLQIHPEQTEKCLTLAGNDLNYYYNIYSLPNDYFEKAPMFLSQYYQKNPVQKVY